MGEHEGKQGHGRPGSPGGSVVAIATEVPTGSDENSMRVIGNFSSEVIHVSILGGPTDRAWIEELLVDRPTRRYVVSDGRFSDVVVVFADQDGTDGHRLPAIIDESVVVWVGTDLGKTLLEAQPHIEARGSIECIERSALSAARLDNAIEHGLEVGRLRRAMRELQDRFDLLVRGANDGLWDWSIADGRAFFSERWRQLLGYEGERMTNRMEDWFSRVHPIDLAPLRSDLDKHVQGRSAHFENEHRVRCRDGSYRWVRCRGLALRDATGVAVRMAGSVTDISDYRAREQAIRHQSRHDSLTGLPRRDPFVENLARAVELAREYDDYGFQVLLVEVGRLRMVNQSIGHEAGDKLLAMVARRLERCLDTEGLVARFGGSKFAILLQDVSGFDVATSLAERIDQKFNEPFEIDGQPVYAPVSIGITSSLRGYKKVEDVISDMIAAATQARSRPSHRREVFHADMRVEALSQMRLEMSLRQAVERREFEVHYQPIMLLETNRLAGFEALVRWNHPQRGLVHPGEFITLSEKTGLIIPIGAWVLEEAVRQLQEWHERYDHTRELAVSVNLSGVQVAQPALFDNIDSIVKSHEIPAGALKIELTESVVIQNAEAATRLLQSLDGAGIQIWVDDFGTGYSSLSHLHRFPVAGLKIDKMFVDELDGTKRSETMVRTIIGLADNLGLHVVAEGIEHRHQADQLRSLGCEMAQGYFFARPMSSAAASELLARGTDSQ